MMDYQQIKDTLVRHAIKRKLKNNSLDRSERGVAVRKAFNVYVANSNQYLHPRVAWKLSYRMARRNRKKQIVASFYSDMCHYLSNGRFEK